MQYRLYPLLIKCSNDIIIFTILLMCMSCHSSLTKRTEGEHILSDTTLIHITVDPAGGEAVAFDSLIDNISFIRLATNDQCLIGEVNQVLCTGNLIFILDTFIANSVYCFDKQGHFIRKIGNVGEGPGEYLRLCNIALTGDQKQIVLYDWSRLHYYDLEGNFVKDESPTFYVNDIKFMTNNFLVGFNDSGSNDTSGQRMLTVHNEDLELIYNEFPTYHTSAFHLSPNMYPLRQFGKYIYLNNPWTNSVYLIKEDKCHEIYRLDIVGGGFPEIAENMDADTFSKIKNTRITFDDYVVLKDHALFYFHQDGFTWSPFVVYSHKTKQTYKCSGATSNPLFFAHSPGNVPPIRYNDETFLVAKSAVKVMEMKESIFNSPLITDPQLTQLYDGLTEDSNPVLFLLHVKPI